MKIRRAVPLEKYKWQIVTIKEAGVKVFIDSGSGQFRIVLMDRRWKGLLLADWIPSKFDDIKKHI
ncbi:MAG: hypothetical protein CMJ79_07290 [Planctomycetaceae bacterium]|nr:hypothetical protein [Planctomycetaceae bacterium]